MGSVAASPTSGHAITADLHQGVRERLARTRQRYTDGRQDLVELLLAARRPVTIPELIDRGAEQSQSSLYRNLAILEQCEVVRRMASVDDVARYELSEDLTEHHHHVRCRECGRLDDMVLPVRVERSLTQAAEAASDQLGYDVDSHHVELVGTCGDCQ